MESPRLGNDLAFGPFRLLETSPLSSPIASTSEADPSLRAIRVSDDLSGALSIRIYTDADWLLCSQLSLRITIEYSHLSTKVREKQKS
jgi:hypothetical protein